MMDLALCPQGRSKTLSPPDMLCIFWVSTPGFPQMPGALWTTTKEHFPLTGKAGLVMNDTKPNNKNFQNILLLP